MAIKGKKKSKQRSAPRAHRHAPVTPPTPLLRRWWFQAGAGALVGAFVVLVLVWVTNNLRADEESANEGVDASRRVAAATAYQEAVRGAYSQVGVVEPGLAPTIFADMNAALDALANGKAPSDATKTFRQAADDAATASKELAAFDVVGTVRDGGFADPIATASFTGSAKALTRVFNLYRQSARVAISAAAVEGAEGARLTDVAVDLREAARAELVQGWAQYLQALGAGGIPELPPGAALPPGLGAG